MAHDRPLRALGNSGGETLGPPERKPEQQQPVTVPELEKRIEERFGVLPNFFRLPSETPEIIEKLWGSHRQPTSIIPYLPFLKSVFSFTCRAFAQSATASLVTLASWWDLADPLATRMRVRKLLQTLFSSCDGPFPGDKNSSLLYPCAQPALHPLLKCH